MGLDFKLRKKFNILASEPASYNRRVKDKVIALKKEKGEHQTFGIQIKNHFVMKV
jgi:hypothetical protein